MPSWTNWLLSIVALAFLGASVMEIGYITYQAAIGEPSHFNMSTTFNRLMWSAMAIAAVVVIAPAAVLGVAAMLDDGVSLAPSARLAVVIGLGLLGVGGKVLYAKLTKKDAVVVDSPDTGEDEFVRRMQADAENAPDCWERDDGFSFVYKSKSGEKVKVDTIAEIPVLFRKNAVCVPEF